MGAGFVAGVKLVIAYLGTHAIIRTILINIVLGLIVKSLSRGPKQYVPPINVTIRSATENRRGVFGKMRAGGTVVFYRTSSSAVAPPDNNILHYIIVYTGHQVSALGDVYIDKQVVTEAQINSGTRAVNNGVFSGFMSIFKYLGTSAQSADADMISQFPGIWDTNHQLLGCSYIHLKMTRSDSAYPQGAPQDVTCAVSGALLYDPRLDSTNGGSGSQRSTDPSTWTYSRNSALALRWYLTGGSVHNDLTTRLIMYGLREVDARIIDAYTIAAANKCDENITGAASTPDGDQVRYTCDLEWSTGENRRDILDAIIATMAGAAVYVKGQWRIYAGAYDTPTITLSQADVFTDIEVTDTTEHSQRYNAVSCVFRDSSNAWVEQTSQFRLNSSYETQDNGERITKEINLRGCSDRYRCQRLCEIDLRKSRAMRAVSFKGSLALLDLAPNETFTFNFPALGWSSYVFRVIERELDFSGDDGWVKLTALIEYSSIYTDLSTGQYNTPNTVTPYVGKESPDAPGSPTTVPQSNAILVKWPSSTTPNVTYSLESSTSSSMSSPTVVYTGADSQAYIDRTATTIYYFRVRALKAGNYSTYAPASGGISGAALGISTSLTATVSPSAASSSGTGASQTTNSVTVAASGGTAPYTYAWTDITHVGVIATDSASAATTTFSAASLGLGETRTATRRCTITDNVAATYTVDVSVTITRINSFTASASGDAPLYKAANATNMTSALIRCTPSGGTGPYTYAWSIVSHNDPNSTPTINTPTSQNCSVTTNDSPLLQNIIDVTVKCVVTDSLSNTATTGNVTITHYHDGGN